MSKLKLRDALAIAVRHTNSKPPEGMAYNVVVIRDGMVRATDGMSGCELQCTDIEGLDLAVDCAALGKMLKAIGDGYTLRTEKGRKLGITGAGVRYQLQAIPKGSEPTFPTVPKSGWSEVSGVQMKALAAVASIVDSKAQGAAFQGLRLSNRCCIGATQKMIAIAWMGLVEEGFTSPPGVFEGLTEVSELVVKDRRLYIQSAGQVRWSLGIVAEWPEESIVNAVTVARDGLRGDGWSTAIKLNDLGLLCRQAEVVVETRADAFKLTLGSGELSLAGQQGKADFHGKVTIEGVGGEGAYVGVEPGALNDLCSVVEASGGDHYLALGGPLHPVMIWNAEVGVILETMLMPMRVE